MRRTGINQSIILHNKYQSKDTSQSILSHLVTLSTHKKETKLQTQILQINTILDAFADSCGKYIEIQYNERGRMIGSKLLTFLFDKRRVISQHNYLVFYHLLFGASPEERSLFSLPATFESRYVRSDQPYKDQEQYECLKAAMRILGLSTKKTSRIMHLLATLLHLGQLEFAVGEEEGAYVKNVQELEWVADALGVDARALEFTLTYKTQMIKKDVTTLILDPNQASVQRDELVSTLYSLLFNWLVEYINTKLCSNDDLNLIGILDLPSHSSLGNFQALCINYANERLHDYIHQYLFEISVQEHKNDGLDCDFVHTPASDCPEFLNNMIDIISSYSKKSDYTDDKQGRAVVDAVSNNNNNNCFSLEKSETGAPLFAIQHFTGQTLYTPRFIEANRDTIDPDFVSLFVGNNADLPASINSFVASLFEQVVTEHHPKQQGTIVSAQSGLGRSPSTKRSKSAENEKSRSKPKTSLVLKQLKSLLGDIFSALDETIPWFVFVIQPTSSSIHFDSSFVQDQTDSLGLMSITERYKAVKSLLNIYTYQDFCERYARVLSGLNIEHDKEPSSRCQAVCDLLNWSPHEDYRMGQTKIFMNDKVWKQLEDMLRSAEKEEQRKQKEHQNVQPVRDIGDEFSVAPTNSTVGSNVDLISNNKKQTKMAAAAASAAGLPLPSLRHSGYYSEASLASAYQQYNYETDTVSEAFGASYMELKNIPQQQTLPIEEEKHEVSGVRKRWLFFVWFMTWWIPSPFLAWCGGMKRKDIQIAWREKVTLCTIILCLSGFIIWFLVFFGKLICPHQNVFSQSELQAHASPGNAYVAIRGEVFDLTKFAPHHWANQVISTSAIMAYAGKDVSDLFPVQVSALCQGVNGSVSEYVSLDYHFNLTDTNSKYHDFRAWTDDYRPDWYFEQMMYFRKNYKLGSMGYNSAEVYKQATMPADISGTKTLRTWAILNGSIYDLTYYVAGGRRVQFPENAGNRSVDGIEVDYMSDVVVNLFRQKSGQDISQLWAALPLDPEVRYRQEVCLRNLFYVGAVDERNSARCIFAEYLLLIVTIFLCLVIVFKFLAALQFGTTREPEVHDKFVICQVPCYTEGEDELRKTIDSIAALQYDDKRKLLFIICDGMIVGGGNDKPTPRIVLDILGVDPSVDPEPLSFLSVGEGQKQHNMGKVYSGLYESSGHVVPYIVVSKVGKPSERQKPGNRGKRDSQLILMKFLNKVHFNAPMTPMELEIYHQIKNVIGVNPSFYEFVLMVDADTEVMPDGLNRLVSAFVHDAKVIGLCGETKLSNEKDTWVTMIQVYEYFISHYMIKAFESLFGSVTCLPGCFCMYRIRSPTKNQPLLASNQVIEDYQINRVDTLHKKNLLHLGEDRYLTTLILKHFPNYKTKFVADAKCATNAPDQWSVLLSQRRRWINSTIHNLGELVFLPQLCGFCCFSMRFVVMLDLVSTLVQPAIVGYLVYLIYTLATSTSNIPLMSIITIAGVYGLQAIIFILHRKWEHIAWMIVSIFAIPVFSFYIPIYSYWHFDDFSWGNTRVVLGEKGKKVIVGADEGHFDPNSIPTMTWDKYEEGLYYDPEIEVMSVGSGSQYTRSSSNTRPSRYTNQYSSSQLFKSSPSFVLNNQHNPHHSLASGMTYPLSPLQRYE
ncbi:hypothetical protein BCV71DRAFT_186878 [Rhizopus microsporus]|uniref:chitin synthase n=1 Tax=Rhizopus microsporus TaxID=58291 RepID=A0A1X0RRN4_RHIZD|nr:hypothetical protein BCV71DRAFT_186878 [Rhizopus microsporus]